MTNQQPRAYPPGALVRVQDICRHPKTGRPGLLPIDRSTWHRWIKAGRVPEGTCIAGSSIKVWPVELVRSLASIPEAVNDQRFTDLPPADQSGQPATAKPPVSA